jgi:hypothetical protein
MPLHSYTTTNRPPTNTDHLLAHPYSIPLAVWQTIAGAVVLLTTLTGIVVSASVARLPETLIATVGVLLIAGGTMILVGLLDDDNNLLKGWRTERTGLILSATAWLTYSTTLLLSYPGSVLSWSLGFAVAAMHSIRLRATQLEERKTRRSM